MQAWRTRRLRKATTKKKRTSSRVDSNLKKEEEQVQRPLFCLEVMIYVAFFQLQHGRLKRKLKSLIMLEERKES